MIPNPIKNNVLVKRDPRQDERNGIFIPDKYQKISVDGEVIAVGKDCVEGLKPGDHVMIGHIITKDVILNNEEYAIVNEDDIFCLMVDDAG